MSKAIYVSINTLAVEKIINRKKIMNLEIIYLKENLILYMYILPLLKVNWNIY